MGRELRRVPLDFNWPLKEVWDGFINPYRKECPGTPEEPCFDGDTAASRWLYALARFIAIFGNDAAVAPQAAELRKRGRIFPHPYITQWSMAERYPFDVRSWDLLPLTSELNELVSGLSGSFDPICGHSALDIYKKLVKAAGLDPDIWGRCPICKGEGIDPAVYDLYSNWEPTDPPEGEGWQLWETVSEGSPISPVFSTEEEFVQYLIRDGISESAARAFCKHGWVPSGAIFEKADGSKELVRGIEILADK